VTSMGHAIPSLRSDTVRILPILIVDEPRHGHNFPRRPLGQNWLILCVDFLKYES